MALDSGPSNGPSHGPRHLGQALTELIALRGYARPAADRQLQEAWSDVAGAQFASQTRAVAVKRGVLQISVAHTPLLSELASFHKVDLLQKFQAKFAHLRVRDLKFKLDGDVGRRGSSEGKKID